MRTLIMTALLICIATSSGHAADYCDRFKFGTPEWWNCIAQDRDTSP